MTIFKPGACTTNNQLTASQNNYAIGQGVVFRLSSDASRDITGIAGGSDGRIIVIFNVGSNAIVLKHESAGSDEANRILAAHGGADHSMAADDGAILVYDATTLRWRIAGVHE